MDNFTFNPISLKLTFLIYGKLIRILLKENIILSKHGKMDYLNVMIYLIKPKHLCYLLFCKVLES